MVQNNHQQSNLKAQLNLRINLVFVGEKTSRGAYAQASSHNEVSATPCGMQNAPLATDKPTAHIDNSC